MNSKQIVKSSGELQSFSAKKLKQSIKRTGLKEKDCESITCQVQKKIHDGMSTRQIYKHAFTLIKKKSSLAATHYSLKKALLELGPTGYEFEYFVAKYFESIGFNTFVGITLQGEFITHEVDVVASKTNYQIYVECKFHNQMSKNNDIKIALYIKARWDDLKNGPDGKYLNAYCVCTNTTFSRDAIKYAEGVGLQLLGINAPPEESFLDKIKKHKLFPITSLRRLKKIHCQELMRKKIILCKDLLNEKKTLSKIGMSPDEIKMLMGDVEKILE